MAGLGFMLKPKLSDLSHLTSAAGLEQENHLAEK
jgi:hypothetical protein